MGSASPSPGRKPKPRETPDPSGEGIGGGGGGNDPCDLVKELTLQAPREVLTQCTLGEVLDVTDRTSGEVRVAVCLRRSTGALVGTLPADATQQLLVCMTTGYSYQAEIIVLDGGHCDVRVTRVF
jgi:hypothetical protein